MADLAIQLTRLSPSVQNPELKKKELKRAFARENKVIKTQDQGNLHLKLACSFSVLEQFYSSIYEYGVAIE